MRGASLTLLLTFSAPLYTLDFATYDEKAREYNLAGNVWYYFEEYNEQQPHEALELLQKGFFTRSASKRLSLGYTAKAVWVAIPFEAPADRPQRLVLELTSLIDRIQFSYMNERGLILDSWLTGRDYPVSSRPAAHRNFVFPLAVDASPQLAPTRFTPSKPGVHRRIILLRLMSQGSMLVPLKLVSDAQFHADDHIEQMVFGVYFGIMLVMVLYNLFLYASTRERSYAFYVFYILFFMLFQFALWGFLHELMLPEYPRLAKYLLPGFLHLATIFQLLFAAQFFQAQAIIPRLYRISGYLSFATFLSMAVGPFIPYRYFITVGIVTGSAGALLIFFKALLLYMKQQKIARFFLIAYTTLIAGVVFLALRNMGVINYSFMSSYSAQIGSALEVILLSLALADRINIWRDEKERAQREVIDREREMSRAFQLFVPQKFLELAGETDFTRLTLGKSTTREIAILFSDIRSFTSLSESMTPEQNFRFLNSYLSRMGPIIRRHGGFIDKFIGDAIMALFPEDHGRSRVGAATEGAKATTEGHGGPKVGAATEGAKATTEGHGGPKVGAATEGAMATTEGHGGPKVGAATEGAMATTEDHGGSRVGAATEGAKATTEDHGGSRVGAATEGAKATTEDLAGVESSADSGGSHGAVAAALEMRSVLKEYNRHRQEQDYKPIDIGIGIHTGTVRLGTIGDNERWEGTVIGDTVNLASRIESLSSTFAAPIVVSGAVLQTIGKGYNVRELDTLRVRGKTQPVTVYEILEQS
jgi:adenylate cyclase